MSDLLQSVKSSYYHDVLGYSDAEARLEGREGAYLFRESDVDVKPGLFIVSYVKSSSVTHILVPRNDGRYIRQSLEQAVDIASDIVASLDLFKHPVPPPSPSSSGSNESESSNSDNDGSRCCFYILCYFLFLHTYQISLPSILH